MGMNVNLTPQLEELVRRKVATGMYNSASEVVRDALRLMAQHDQVHEVKLEQLRQEIKLGLNSGDACLLYTSPSPRDGLLSRMPSSA